MVEGAISAPANTPLLETGGKRDIPNHVGVFRIRINIQVKRVCPVIGCIHHSFDQVSSRKDEVKSVLRTAGVGKGSLGWLIYKIIGDDKWACYRACRGQDVNRVWRRLKHDPIETMW